MLTNTFVKKIIKTIWDFIKIKIKEKQVCTYIWGFKYELVQYIQGVPEKIPAHYFINYNNYKDGISAMFKRY